jgi:hypothetical protein
MPVESGVVSAGYENHARVALNNVENTLAGVGKPRSMVSQANDAGLQGYRAGRADTEPAAVLLLGFGLIVLATIGRKNLVRK